MSFDLFTAADPISRTLASDREVLHASGVRWTGNVTGKSADAKALFAAMHEAGVEHDSVSLAEQGWRRTREALPILLPLLARTLPVGELSTADDEFPPVVIGRSGVPTYCYDGFSREGIRSLAQFLKRDTATVRWLRKYVPSERHLAVLAGAIFRVEGGLVRQRIEWPCAMTLRWLADSGYHGMKLSDPAAFLATVRGDLPTVDEERANVR